MNRRLFLTMILAMLIAAGAGAKQLDPDETLDMSLKDADLAQVLGVFATMKDLDLDAPSDLAGTVSVELKDVPWSSALEQVCKINRLECRVEPPRLVVRPRTTAPPPPAAAPITIMLREAALHDTLRAFAKISQQAVVIDPALPAGTVTLSFDHVPANLALEEICRLEGCRVEWTATEIHIHATGDADLEARRIEQEFQAVPLHRVLESFRGLPLWGGALGLEVEPKIAARPVTASVESAGWTELLDAVCDAAACDWLLSFDGAGRHTLRVVDRGGRLASHLHIEAFAGNLAGAMKHLGEHLGMPLVAVPSLAPDAAVAWSERDATGSALLDELCRQIDCRWHLRGRGIQLVPLNPIPYDSRPRDPGAPSAGSTNEGPALGLRLTSPGSAPANAAQRFSWAHAIGRVGSDTGTQALLVWLPFGEGRQLVLPIFVDCAADRLHGERVHALPPVPLPILGPTSVSSGSSELEITPLGTATAARTAGPRPCRQKQPAAGMVVATLEAAGDQRLILDLEPGRFLLVTPPASGAAAATPAAALVSLGTNAAGDPLIALVEPRPGGAYDLALHTITRSPVTTTLSSGHRLVLAKSRR